MPVLTQKITETIVSVIESSFFDHPLANRQQSYGDVFVYLPASGWQASH
jgi:hypothetical protein